MSPLTMVYLNILNDIKQVIETTYASKCYWNIFPGSDETVYLRFTVNDDKQKTNGKRAPIINWDSGLMTSLDSPGQFRVLVGFLKSEFDFVQEIIDDYPQQVFLQEKDGLPF